MNPARIARDALLLRSAATETTVDLAGDYACDLDASIRGGVCEATVEGGLGRIDADGLTRKGDLYVNGVCADSDVTLEVDVRGGVGEIDLRG